MTPGAYSFIGLAEIVAAKLQRRLDLQAEIAKIDQELREAYAALGEIPSLQRPAAPVGVEAVAAAEDLLRRDRDRKNAYYAKIVPRTCRDCGAPFEGRRTRKLCPRCSAESMVQRVALARAARLQKRQPVDLQP